MIVGYLWQTEIYCSRCIVKVLPTGEGEAFDGWAVVHASLNRIAAVGVRMSPEDNLDEIAAAFGFDRSDEHSFDSSEFPKPITDQMERADGVSHDCDRCGEKLLED